MPRPWVVLKFGGTSVASAARWERIGVILRRRLAAGERPLVVCSAVSGVSDLLEGLVARLGRGEPTTEARRELAERHRKLAGELDVPVDDLLESCETFLDRVTEDVRAEGWLRPERRAALIALGELLSTALGARWLVDRGIRATRYDARELLEALPPLATASAEQRYLDARCAHRPDAQARDALDACESDVIVTQGFIARDREGDTVLLGRGGSDTAAAYLAAKIGASRVEIWTDVPGLFSCNPRLVPGAWFLPRVGYDEAETLAGFGAQVLHPRTIHPVREAGIPLVVKWTERPDLAGTRVSEEAEATGPQAVVSRDRVSLLTIEKPAGWKPIGVLADVATCFKEGAVPIDMLTSSPSRIRVLVDLSVAGVRERLPHIVERLSETARVRTDPHVASVTVVGRGLHTRLQALAPALEQLAGERILMLSHCASDLSVTFVVPETAERSVVKALHEELFGDAGERPTWRDLVEALDTEPARTEALA